MDVNALKTKSGCYYCIISTIYSPRFMKSMVLYFVAVSQSTGGFTFN